MTMRIFKSLLTIALLAVGIIGAPSAAPPAQPAYQQSPDGTLRRLRVPILMYHYVSELPSQADELRVGLTVHPQQFRDQLAYLQQHGYSAVSLYEVYDALAHGAPLPPNPIVLTFDDGYTDHINSVLPALLDYGFRATFFIITGFPDELHDGYMSWPQIQTLTQHGMEIAAHSKTHPDLRQRDHDLLVYQVLGSAESIAANVGLYPSAFAYPMGRYDDHTISVVAQTGIRIAVTTGHGATHTTDSLLELNRLRVQNSTTVSRLEALLREP